MKGVLGIWVISFVDSVVLTWCVMVGRDGLSAFVDRLMEVGCRFGLGELMVLYRADDVLCYVISLMDGCVNACRQMCRCMDGVLMWISRHRCKAPEA